MDVNWNYPREAWDDVYPEGSINWETGLIIQSYGPGTVKPSGYPPPNQTDDVFPIWTYPDDGAWVQGIYRGTRHVLSRDPAWITRACGMETIIVLFTDTDMGLVTHEDCPKGFASTQFVTFAGLWEPFDHWNGPRRLRWAGGHKWLSGWSDGKPSVWLYYFGEDRGWQIRIDDRDGCGARWPIDKHYPCSPRGVYRFPEDYHFSSCPYYRTGNMRRGGIAVIPHVPPPVLPPWPPW